MDSNGIRPYVIAKGKTFNDSLFVGFRKENDFANTGQRGMMEVLSFRLKHTYRLAYYTKERRMLASDCPLEKVGRKKSGKNQEKIVVPKEG